MKKIMLICIVAMAMTNNAHAKTKLSIHQGTMSAGGSLALTINKFTNKEALIGVRLAPEFSYFLVKGLALGLSTQFEKVSLSHDQLSWDISLGFGLKYHIDLGGAIYPYFGGEVAMILPKQQEKMGFAITVPMGFLVPVNSQVAFNIGLPISFIFSDGYQQMKINAGYLGMAAFF